MTDHADTIRRVERKYANEVAEAANRASERDVSTWLAGVSFKEWFDLVAERQQAIDERDRLRLELQATQDAALMGHYDDALGASDLALIDELRAQLRQAIDALRAISDFDIGVRLAPVAACKEIASAALLSLGEQP